MTDLQETTMLKQMKSVDKLIDKIDTEVIIYAIDKIGKELQRRSDREVEYHNKRFREINNV